MKTKKIFTLILILFAMSIFAETTWRDRNIYTTENLAQGDTIIVIIEDVSRLRFNIDLQTQNNSTVNSTPDVNITGFLPKVATEKSSDNKDKVKMDGRTNLNLKVAVSVTGNAGQGRYNINGYKEYSFNGVLTRFTVSGIVGANVVKGNKVKSENIVNFRLAITGVKSGLNLALQRAALGEDESASSNLTEAEKQAIILDYLRKMINEMSR